MRTHILSRYSEETERTTEFQILGRTSETKSIENSDLDEFIAGKTAITEQVETSDPDEFTLQAPTARTFQIEDSDLDEFIWPEPTCCGEDFDTINEQNQKMPKEALAKRRPA